MTGRHLRRNLDHAIATTRGLIELPADLLEQYDAAVALTVAAAGVPAPHAPPDPGHGELIADPVAHARAALAHQGALAEAEHARKMCADRAQHIRSILMPRTLQQAGQQIIAGPMRAKVTQLIEGCRPHAATLGDLGFDDPTEVAKRATPAELKAWQASRTAQAQLDALTTLWGLICTRKAVGEIHPAELGGAAAWACPDLVPDPYRGTYPQVDQTPAARPATTEILLIAWLPREAGYRLPTTAELQAAVAAAEHAAAAQRRQDEPSERIRARA